MSEKVLIVGGAGYIGSAAAAYLLDQGCEIHVLDDLSTGHREALLAPGFTRARAGDRAVVSELLRSRKFDLVMDFAGSALVSESVENPGKYFENNVDQTRALLEAMVAAGARRVVFSSSCAVYGSSDSALISEGSLKKPVNPYGASKLKAEEVLTEFAESHGIQAIALRYFNVAGAEPGLRVGERHEPETHLLPSVLQGLLKAESVPVYGLDHPTPDGTCIRDYTHVWDIARAHHLAMARLIEREAASPAKLEVFNIGTGRGHSVREVISACQRVTGILPKIAEKPRRPGDPPALVADASLAREILGFRADYGLEDMIRSAWSWHSRGR